MTLVYVVGTPRQVEDLITNISRPLYLDDFKDQHPSSQTRMEKDYKDRITDEVKDTMIQLSVTGRDHADRYDDPVLHPSDPNLALVSYDDRADDIKLNPAYYYNLTARTRNGADASLTNNTLEEAEASGFFPIQEDGER